MTEERVLQLFKCLADRSRLRIVQSLLREDMYAERLAQRLGVTPATVSFHMKKLEEAGLVTSRSEQYYTVYTLRRDDLTLPLVELIAGASDQTSEQERREAQYRRKVIETFFEYGRLKAIPAQRKKERICLEEMVRALEPGRVYTEPELNEVLLRFHEDYCTLRRDMISEGLLTRDGGLYTRVGQAPPRPSTAKQKSVRVSSDAFLAYQIRWRG